MQCVCEMKEYDCDLGDIKIINNIKYVFHFKNEQVPHTRTLGPVPNGTLHVHLQWPLRVRVS